MILGIDTSAVDGNKPCDWQKVKDAGVDFVILKRGQGMRADTCYARDSEAVRKTGMPLGCYVFPDTRNVAASVKAQVSAWKKFLGKVDPKTDLPIALDVEANDWASKGRTLKELIRVITEFVLELHDQFGAWPMIYTSYNQWNMLGLPAFAYGVKCPMWVKTAYRLKAKSPPDQVIPPTPHVGRDARDQRHARNYYRIPDPWARTGWAIQQYQGDAVGFPGMSKTIDLNRFNQLKQGSKDPFVRWVQRVVNAPGGDDGDFGTKTAKAVSAFQTTHGLPATGIVDVVTFSRLAWANT